MAERCIYWKQARVIFQKLVCNSVKKNQMQNVEKINEFCYLYVLPNTTKSSGLYRLRKLPGNTSADLLLTCYWATLNKLYRNNIEHEKAFSRLDHTSTSHWSYCEGSYSGLRQGGEAWQRMTSRQGGLARCPYVNDIRVSAEDLL